MDTTKKSILFITLILAAARTRTVITVMAMVLSLMCLWTHQADALLFNDGQEHTIDYSYNGYCINVEDSPTGKTTTLNIITPAEINTFTLETTSVLSKATHGGKAFVNIMGGTLQKELSPWMQAVQPFHLERSERIILGSIPYLWILSPNQLLWTSVTAISTGTFKQVPTVK